MPQGATLLLALLAVAVIAVALWWREQLARLATDRREAEALRHALTLRVEMLRQLSPDAVVVADREGRIAEANDRASLMFGHGREELLRLRIADLVAPAEQPRVADRIAQLLRDGGGTFETDHRRRDGTVFPAAVEVRTFVADGQGYVQGVIRDLTVQRRTLAELRSGEQAFRSAFHGAGFAMALADGGGRILEHNRSLRDLLGREVTELCVARVADLCHPEDRAALERLLAALPTATAPVSRLALRLLRPDGAALPVTVRATAIRDAAAGNGAALLLLEALGPAAVASSAAGGEVAAGVGAAVNLRS